MKVTYTIDGALIDVLRVVAEVKAITGMIPDNMQADCGNLIKYSREDCKLLFAGKMNEQEYINHNTIRSCP